MDSLTPDQQLMVQHLMKTQPKCATARRRRPSLAEPLRRWYAGEAPLRVSTSAPAVPCRVEY